MMNESSAKRGVGDITVEEVLQSISASKHKKTFIKDIPAYYCAPTVSKSQEEAWYDISRPN